MKSFSLNTTERAFSDSLFGLLTKISASNGCDFDPAACVGSSGSLVESGLVVAFSGGCDSLALLSLATKVLGPDLVHAVYVNHNLRGDDELACELELNESNCRKLGMPLEVCTLERGSVLSLSSSRRCGTEEAARILRYEALESKRVEHSCLAIATAHHRQDQIETVAMRLRAGSPVGSLRGIAGYDAARHLVRPLLSFDRLDLESYLNDAGLVWSTDSTNQDTAYSRNLFRNEILPAARLSWPGCDDYLLALSRAAVDEVGELSFGVIDGVRLEHGVGSVWVDASAFCGLCPARRTMVLFEMWDSLMGDADLPMTLVMRVLRALENGNDCRIGANQGIFSLYRGRLGLFKEEVRTGDSLESGYSEGFRKPNDFENPSVCKAEHGLEGAFSKGGPSMDPGGFELSFDPNVDQCIDLPYGLSFRSGVHAVEATCGMDRSKLLFMDPKAFKGQVCIRFVKEGDSIRLKAGKRMVRRLLQDMKVPSDLRSKVPVLVDEDGVCAVFARAFGGVDRICVKFRTSLAPNNFTLYIVNHTVLKG